MPDAPGAAGHAGSARLGSARDGRSARADAWLTGLLGAGGGVALAAVGGYGRRELGPGSDLDVVMVHDDRSDIGAVADKVWYPIWDSGQRLDHSVRTVREAVAVAGDDLRAALGLLAARHVAGDPELTARLRREVFAAWRARASRRLPELHEMARARAQRWGEVAFLLEPDLKEARGGLRDVHALEAIAAAWVAPGPRPAVRSAYRWLLDVRDVLQTVSGRASTRLVAQEQAAVAVEFGLADADALMLRVSEAARVIAYAGDVTWRSVEGSLRRRPKVQRRPLVDGVVEQDGEVVLARGADPASDPVLMLRAAAAAAQAGLPLAPPTVDRLVAASPAMPLPWPPAARDALVSLLGAGRPALAVLEALDQAGAVEKLLPEWARVRNRRQRNPVHRFTVDRHLIETAIEASAVSRRVRRPDILLLAALFHDIGKGCAKDHSISGAALMPGIAARLGIGSHDEATLVALVRHHLLLSQTATRRDLADPATVAGVAAAVGSHELLELLAALTEADARATGPGVWDHWRARLVADLVDRTSAALAGAAPDTAQVSLPGPVLDAVRSGELAVLALPVLPEQRGQPTSRVAVVAPDQPGLLWRAAGVLALHRLGVRAATATSSGPTAVTLFDVEPAYLGEVDPVRIREDVRRALDGSLDPAQRLTLRAASQATPKATDRPPPAVLLARAASDSATVIEVRAHDRLGMLFTVTRVLAAEGLDVRAARVETLGAEVVDAFYVTDAAGAPLTDARAEQVRRAVEAELGG